MSELEQHWTERRLCCRIVCLLFVSKDSEYMQRSTYLENSAEHAPIQIPLVLKQFMEFSSDLLKFPEYKYSAIR